MLFHNITVNDVHSGDHLYRWWNLKQLQGIAVQQDDNIFVVMSNGSDTLRWVTLSEFKGKGILRRAIYDQGDSYLHWIKLSGTSFTEKRRPTIEIVKNALLLFEITNRNPERLQEILGNDFSDFARLCSTISHDRYRNKLLRDGNNLSLIDNFERISHHDSTTTIDEQKVKDLEDKIETLEDKQSCAICMDRPNNVAFLCGHLACFDCAATLKRCHFCERDIHEKVKLFWP